MPLDEKEDAALLARLRGASEGAKPTVPSIPPPGIYWLRTVECGGYWVDRAGNKVGSGVPDRWWIRTWEVLRESEWFIADVEEDGSYGCIGSDESSNWERSHSFVSRVGPKIEPPTEE